MRWLFKYSKNTTEYYWKVIFCCFNLKNFEKLIMTFGVSVFSSDKVKTLPPKPASQFLFGSTPTQLEPGLGFLVLRHIRFYKGSHHSICYVIYDHEFNFIFVCEFLWKSVFNFSMCAYCWQSVFISRLVILHYYLYLLNLIKHKSQSKLTTLIFKVKPYETNCGLWIWAIQIKFDWLIEDWPVLLWKAECDRNSLADQKLTLVWV